MLFLNVINVECLLYSEFSAGHFSCQFTNELFHLPLRLLLIEFQPEPPVFGSEIDVIRPEVPFENYVFIASFRFEEIFGELDDYLGYFKNWTDTTPGFEV